MTLGVALPPRLEDLAPLRSTLSEATLMRGYSRTVATAPCACGTDVVQLGGEDIAEAMQRHQATPRHAAWSADWRWA